MNTFALRAACRGPLFGAMVLVAMLACRAYAVEEMILDSNSDSWKWLVNGTSKDKMSFTATRGEAIWQGDSVQMAFDTARTRTEKPENIGDYEMSFAQVDGKPFVFPNFAPADQPFALQDIGFEFTQGADELRYQIHYPWKTLLPFSLEKDNWLGYFFVINQNDGQGRKFCEWTSGIATGQSPARYGLLILDKAARGIAAEMLVERTEVLDTQPVGATVYVPANAARTIAFKLALNGKTLQEETYSVGAGESRFEFSLQPTDMTIGENTLAVQVAMLPEKVVLLDRQVTLTRLSTRDIIKKTKASSSRRNR
jgi:hypothetical protein